MVTMTGAERIKHESVILQDDLTLHIYVKKYIYIYMYIHACICYIHTDIHANLKAFKMCI